MSDVVKLARRVVAAGTCRHVFCSWVQLSGWYEKLESMQGEVSNFEADSEVEAAMRRARFEVKSVPPLLYASTG